jgi:hypothetical protein
MRAGRFREKPKVLAPAASPGSKCARALMPAPGHATTHRSKMARPTLPGLKPGTRTLAKSEPTAARCSRRSGNLVSRLVSKVRSLSIACAKVLIARSAYRRTRTRCPARSGQRSGFLPQLQQQCLVLAGLGGPGCRKSLRADLNVLTHCRSAPELQIRVPSLLSSAARCLSQRKPRAAGLRKDLIAAPRCGSRPKLATTFPACSREP